MGRPSLTDAPIIAIVDDDASVRRSLERVLRPAGYATQAFRSAREFLGWLPDAEAACLVLDVHLGGMSGFELQRRLAVPVLLITGHDDPVTRARLEASGAAGHLSKPFDEDVLLAAIRRAVRRAPHGA